MKPASIEMHGVICAECGILFGVPSKFVEVKAMQGGSIRCPNGHENVWPDAGKMNPSRDELQAEIVTLKTRVAELVHEAEKREALEGSKSVAVSPALVGAVKRRRR